MTGLDTNILIDLMVSSSQFHEESKNNLDNLTDSLCITPTNVGECLRLLTHVKVFPSPLTLSKACKTLDQFLQFYKIQILEEPNDWWKGLSELGKYIPGVKGNEIFDARIALCLKEHNVKRIFTRDSDFLKYNFLQPIHSLK